MNNRLPRGRGEDGIDWERRKAEQAARKAAVMADPVRRFYQRHGLPPPREARVTTRRAAAAAEDEEPGHA